MTSTQSDARTAILDRFANATGGAVRSLAAEDRALVDMPAEILRFEVPDAGRYYFVHIADALREKRPLSDAELDWVRTRAQVRAEEEFPLPLILHNWMRGAGILASALVDATRAGEEGALADLLRDLLGPIEQLVTAVAETYIQQRDVLAKHERGTEQLVARALLAGQDAAGLAEQAGISLAAEYDVVAVAFAEPAAADEDSIAVARRRRVLRVMSAIDRSGRRDVMGVVDGDTGFLLVPKREGGAGAVGGAAGGGAASGGGVVGGAGAGGAGTARGAGTGGMSGTGAVGGAGVGGAGMGGMSGTGAVGGAGGGGMSGTGAVGGAGSGGVSGTDTGGRADGASGGAGSVGGAGSGAGGGSGAGARGGAVSAGAGGGASSARGGGGTGTAGAARGTGGVGGAGRTGVSVVTGGAGVSAAGGRIAAGRAVGAIIEAVRKAAEGTVTSAVAVASVERIPDAAAEAERVLAIATANGLGPGPHELGAVALDYQIATPGIARDRLITVLDPLQSAPELVATVETLLHCDGDRNRAARTLGVHPNTIANRIARITALLGFDPLSTHGIVTLSAAFAARRAAALDA